MRQHYLVCVKCGKKGMQRFRRGYAGYECKYCKAHSVIAVRHIWGFYTMKRQEWNYEEAKKYAEANGHIDKENRYIVHWDDEKQGLA